MKKAKSATFTKMNYKDMLYVSGGIIFTKLATKESTEDGESLDAFLKINKHYVTVKNIPNKLGKVIIFDRIFCETNGIDYHADEHIEIGYIYRSLLKTIFLLGKKIELDENKRDAIKCEGKEYFFDNFKSKINLEKTACIVTTPNRVRYLKQKGFQNICVPEIARERFVEVLMGYMYASFQTHNGENIDDLFSKLVHESEIINIEHVRSIPVFEKAAALPSALTQVVAEQKGAMKKEVETMEGVHSFGNETIPLPPEPANFMGERTAQAGSPSQKGESGYAEQMSAIAKIKKNKEPRIDYSKYKTCLMIEKQEELDEVLKNPKAFPEQLPISESPEIKDTDGNVYLPKNEIRLRDMVANSKFTERENLHLPQEVVSPYVADIDDDILAKFKELADYVNYYNATLKNDVTSRPIRACFLNPETIPNQNALYLSSEIEDKVIKFVEFHRDELLYYRTATAKEKAERAAAIQKERDYKKYLEEKNRKKQGT